MNPDISELGRQVLHQLRTDGEALGLVPGKVRANYVLNWPLVHGENAVKWRELPIPVTDERFGQRMDFYMRVQTFDWTLDTLADWVDCDMAPVETQTMRAEKMTTHLRYLEMYQVIYRS